MLRILCYVIGVLMVSFGLTFCFFNFNLLTLGYSFLEYLLFILKKLECLQLIVGILLIWLSLKKGKEK